MNLKVVAAVTTAAVVGAAGLAAVVRIAADDGLDRFDDGTLAFEYPSQWKRASWHVQSSFETLVTYLSTESLSDPCRRSSDMITCGEPLRRLRAGGVLVEWSRVGFPEVDRQRLEEMPGKWTTVADRRAKLAVDLLPVCAGVGAERSLFALIPLSTRANYYAMRACLRAPRLDQRERDVRDILASTRIEGF